MSGSIPKYVVMCIYISTPFSHPNNTSEGKTIATKKEDVGLQSLHSVLHKGIGTYFSNYSDLSYTLIVAFVLKTNPTIN